MNLTPTKTLAIAAGAFGLYSLVKSLWYLQHGTGCAKCDKAQAVLGAGLVLLAVWVWTRQ